MTMTPGTLGHWLIRCLMNIETMMTMVRSHDLMYGQRPISMATSAEVNDPGHQTSERTGSIWKVFMRIEDDGKRPQPHTMGSARRLSTIVAHLSTGRLQEMLALMWLMATHGQCS